MSAVVWDWSLLTRKRQHGDRIIFACKVTRPRIFKLQGGNPNKLWFSRFSDFWCQDWVFSTWEKCIHYKMANCNGKKDWFQFQNFENFLCAIVHRNKIIIFNFWYGNVKIGNKMAKINTHDTHSSLSIRI